MPHVIRSGVVGIALSGLLGAPGSAAGQIPQGEYLRYVPLRYPRIVRQTDASARFHLYGNPQDPDYRDLAPVDGIDDRRAAWLLALATRFAPIMVRNTEQFPMDFRAFYDRGPFPIFADRWDIARASFALEDSVAVDMARLRENPCPAPGANDGDDCRLLELIERFGPERGPLEPEASAPAEREIFSLLHFDLPGYDEKTWRQEYGTHMRERYGEAARVFAHPFIAAPPAEDGRPAGYELVIQYWFFYPSNDGPNNHEGDWEHINVIVSPRSLVSRALDASAIERLVSGHVQMDGPDPLVLRRIEYYLHHFVVPMDFAEPDAYQPRADWEREVERLARTRRIDRRLLQRTRRRAWRDESETTINTRPIVWIGGDGIGIQNVLQTPGLKDRDGHASYPYRGYYKRIGAGQVGERVIREFDHVEYFSRPKPHWQYIEDYGAPDKIALTPDWERVLGPVRTDAAARRDWSWLVLPLRFGYPASPSPAAGLARHADLGNVSVVGPAYNDGWNRLGDSAGYELYELVETSWAQPLGLTDSFFPRLGFLNAPIIYFLIKPPLDLIWRTAALPVRAALGTRQPTFLPASAPAERRVSFEAGPMVTDLNDDFVGLFFTREQLPEIIVRIALALPADADNLEIRKKFTWAAAPAYALVFHLSPRFSAESALVRYKASIGFDFVSPDLPQPIQTRGDLDQFEFQGATRFNLMTGNLQPYVKYGHGITWFRLENVRVNGVPLSKSTSRTFRPKSRWIDFGFNQTIVGGGLDWTGTRVGPAWIGVKASYTFIHHDLGFEQYAAVEAFPELARTVAGTTFSIWRQQARVLVSLGF